MYRKLSESRPDVFLSDLARSLSNMGTNQNGLGQHEAAAASTQEALDAIWPLFLRVPAVFERTTGMILSNLRVDLDALGRSPSADLQARIKAFEAKGGA